MADMEPYSREWMDCKELFRERFEKLTNDFIDGLKWGKETKSKYREVLWWLNEYLYGYTDCMSFEAILPGDVGSRFYNHCKYDCAFEPNYKKRLLEFFLYLKDEGYENEKVIKYLSKK